MKESPIRLLLKKGSSRILLYSSFFAGLLWTFLLISGAWLISSIIIATIHNNDRVNLLLQLFALYIFRALFLALFENWTLKKAVNSKHELRSTATKNPFGLRSLSPATMSNLLTKGLNSIDTYYGRFAPQMIFALITPTALICLFFYIDKLSALIAIATLPLIPFFGYLIGRYTSDAVDKKWQTLSTLSSYFEDSLRGFATLKIFGRQKNQSARILEMGKRYNQETMKVLRISFLSSLALELAATISVALMAVSIGLRLVNGSIDFKVALVILILAPEVYFPLRNAASLFHASTDGTETLRQIYNLPKNEIPQKISSESLVWDCGKLNFGEQLFLIGDSGVGKTRIALELIGKYQDIAWIPQHPMLATGTVRDQFKLINPEISDLEITNHLIEVGLLLSQLPKGLESRLESGSELISSASGGQIRKIAIARAIAKRAKFIIADEPTADLDQISAKQVISLLRKQNAGLLVITHDYSLINSTDRVLTLGKR